MLRIADLQEEINKRIDVLRPAIVEAANLLVEDVNKKTGSDWEVHTHAEEPAYWRGEEEPEGFGWNEIEYPIVIQYAVVDNHSVLLAIPVTSSKKDMLLYLQLSDSEELGTQVYVYSYDSSLCYNDLFGNPNFGVTDRLGGGIVQIYTPDSLGFFGRLGGHTPDGQPDFIRDI